MSAEWLDLDALTARIKSAEENWSPVPTMGMTTAAVRALIAAVRERDALVDGLRVLIQGATLADDDDPIGWISTDALRDLLDRTTGTDDRSADA